MPTSRAGRGGQGQPDRAGRRPPRSGALDGRVTVCSPSPRLSWRPMSRFRGWPLRLTIAAAVVVVLLGGGALAFVLTREGDVSNPNVEFRDDTPTPTPTATPTPTPKKRGKKVDPADTFVWPFYGYPPDRRRYFAGASLRPPYTWLWT